MIIAEMNEFKQLRIEAWKNQDYNGVWTRDLAIPLRLSNELSYEATVVANWSFVSSNEPVKNGCEVTYEMFRILNCGFEIKWAMIIARVQTPLKRDAMIIAHLRDFKSVVQYMKHFICHFKFYTLLNRRRVTCASLWCNSCEFIERS